MAIVRKTISVDESQDAWVKSQVASGRFASDSEVYRALVKDVRTKETKLKWLERELQKGLDSPLIGQSPQEVIAELKDELRAKGEL